ncbi:MAG: hypothetical protein WCI53_05120 [Bacteroidota bacterium]|jgi:hypothetical protein
MKSLNQANSIKKLLVILTILNLVACDNKLDINAPYKQIPVIYGFVNKNEVYQFIRVQKVFQNSVDINAKDAAKISDSLYLPNLSVQIIYIKNNGRDTVNCTRIDSIDKKSGFFANDKNYIYRSDYYVIQSDVIKAALLVKDTILGNTYTSECNIIGDQKIDSRNITVSDNPSNKFRFTYTLNKSAYIIDAAIRFNYFEYPIGNPKDSVLKYYDYYLQSGLTTARLVDNISISVISKVLLDDWRAYFKNQPNDVVRKFASVEYVTWGAGPEFLEIQEISKPNVSFVQKRTDYSNIKNALGIFAARTMNVQTDVTFDAASIDLISEMQQFEK